MEFPCEFPNRLYIYILAIVFVKRALDWHTLRCASKVDASLSHGCGLTHMACRVPDPELRAVLT